MRLPGFEPELFIFAIFVPLVVPIKLYKPAYHFVISLHAEEFQPFQRFCCCRMDPYQNSFCFHISTFNLYIYIPSIYKMHILVNNKYIKRLQLIHGSINQANDY